MKTYGKGRKYEFNWHSAEELDPTLKIIASYKHVNNRQLAAMLGCSEKTSHYKVKHLVSKGLVTSRRVGLEAEIKLAPGLQAWELAGELQGVVIPPHLK